MKGKYILRAFLVAMSVTSAMGLGGCGFLGGDEDPTSGEFLSKVASEVNKNVPMMVDKDTELMNTMGLEGVFVYNYRLVNLLSAKDLDLNKFLEILRPQVTNAACTQPDTRAQFLDKGVVLRYTYSDKDRRHLAQIDVNPADCGS